MAKNNNQRVSERSGGIIDALIKRPDIRLADDSEPSPKDEDAILQVNDLASQWIRERTRGVDIHDMTDSVPYKKIVAMGEPAIRPLLLLLQKKPDHWFDALYQITHENPVPPEAEGKIKLMAEAWLRWGREKGYIREVGR